MCKMRGLNSRVALLAICGLLSQPLELSIHLQLARAELRTPGSDVPVGQGGASTNRGRKNGPAEGAGRVADPVGSPAEADEQASEQGDPVGESNASVAEGVTSSNSTLERAMEDVLAEAAAEAEAAAAVQDDGFMPTQASVKEGPGNPELMWLPLAGITEQMRLFNSLVAAEDVTLLDSSHRPWVEGVTPEEHEVKAENCWLQKHLCSTQVPEFLPSDISVPSPLEHSAFRKAKAHGDYQYWVPLAQRQAKSWWQNEGPPLPMDKLETAKPKQPATSHPHNAAGRRAPSSMYLADITEVMDASSFGISSLYHPEAYAEHLQCDNFYSTMFFRTKTLSPWSAICSFQQLTAFAEKVGQLLKARVSSNEEVASPSSPPADEWGPLELSQSSDSSDEGFADHEASGTTNVDVNFFKTEDLKDVLGVGKSNSKWWHHLIASPLAKLSDRAHVAELLLRERTRARIYPAGVLFVNIASR